MTDQQQPSAIQSSSETSKHPAMIPYERFVEVNRELKELRNKTTNATEKKSLEENLSGSSESSTTDTVDEIFKRLVEDPEAYLKEIISHLVQHELELIKEELELRNALKYARQRYPEFKSFENYIIQELTGIVDEDPDFINLSWDEILDKGITRLQNKFKSALQNLPSVNSDDEVKKAYMEGHATRKIQPVVPSFSREEISGMSMKDFLKHEEFINEALKNNRIR